MSTQNNYDDFDTQYNEEMSRTPVGRLMAKADESNWKANPFVTGFDAAPKQAAPGPPPRQAPRAKQPPASPLVSFEDDDPYYDDPQPPPPQPRPRGASGTLPRPHLGRGASDLARGNPGATSPRPRTGRGATGPMGGASDMARGGATGPVRGATGPRTSTGPLRGTGTGPLRAQPLSRGAETGPNRGFGTGPVRPSGATGPRGNTGSIRGSTAPLRGATGQTGRIDQNTRPRRGDSATTRMAAGEEDHFESGFRDGARRGRSRALADAAYDNMDMPPDDQPISTQGDEFDSFRKRYNPNELVSLGRGGAAPRQQRPQSPPRSSAAAAPAGLTRMILAGAAVLIFILTTILAVQLNSVVSARNDLQTRLDGLTAEDTVTGLLARVEDLDLQLQTSRAETAAARAEAEELRLAAITTPPQTYTPGGGGGNPHAAQPPATLPQLPTTHRVVEGDHLQRIAMMYFGNDYAETLNHIVRTNQPRIFNRDILHVGWNLQILPMD